MADPELRIGPMDPNEKTDPADPETAAAFTGRYGVHNNARRLINAIADAYPPELKAAGSMPVDEERTAALDLEEVEGAIPGDGELVSAKVRGDRQKVVVYVLRYQPKVDAPEGSGRTTRGFLPYEGLSRSESAFDEERERKLGLSAAAVRAGAGDDERGQEDPRVAALQEEVRRLRAEKENGAEEPWEGFSGESAEAIKDRIDEEPDDSVEELKARVRTYEESHKNRKGVLDAAAPADAPSGQSGPPS